ncbi:Conserved_hypothetical protein [Hexamita inflata]|uniref:Uncharacterized protein n=1 Tax=Hexamita inflata TaxID=28002 RepID=A0AA86UQL0_9EUKA|nr:Conserved hypothetical protein [Hexamita inflata]
MSRAPFQLSRDQIQSVGPAAYTPIKRSSSAPNISISSSKRKTSMLNKQSSYSLYQNSRLNKNIGPQSYVPLQHTLKGASLSNLGRYEYDTDCWLKTLKDNYYPERQPAPNSYFQSVEYQLKKVSINQTERGLLPITRTERLNAIRKTDKYNLPGPGAYPTEKVRPKSSITYSNSICVKERVINYSTFFGTKQRTNETPGPASYKVSNNKSIIDRAGRKYQNSSWEKQTSRK